MTKKELLKKIESLELKDDDQRNKVVCSIIGHSMIMTTFFGYYYCARCGVQVGDALGSAFPAAERAVIVGHNCETCRENYKKLTWKDKLYCPDPFKTEEEKCESENIV